MLSPSTWGANEKIKEMYPALAPEASGKDSSGPEVNQRRREIISHIPMTGIRHTRDINVHVDYCGRGKGVGLFHDK